MAKRDWPLAIMDDRPVWEDDLDLNWAELRNIIVGSIIVIAFLVAVCFAGSAK